MNAVAIVFNVLVPFLKPCIQFFSIWIDRIVIQWTYFFARQRFFRPPKSLKRIALYCTILCMAQGDATWDNRKSHNKIPVKTLRHTRWYCWMVLECDYAIANENECSSEFFFPKEQKVVTKEWEKEKNSLAVYIKCTFNIHPMNIQRFFMRCRENRSLWFMTMP